MTVKITQSTFSLLVWCEILVWDHQTIFPNSVFYLTKHHNTGLRSQVWDSEGTCYILSFSGKGASPGCGAVMLNEPLPQEVRNLCSAPILPQTAGETGQGTRVIFPSAEGLRQCSQSHKCKKLLSVLGTTDFLRFSEIWLPQTLGSFYSEL